MGTHRLDLGKNPVEIPLLFHCFPSHGVSIVSFGFPLCLHSFSLVSRCSFMAFPSHVVSIVSFGFPFHLHSVSLVPRCSSFPWCVHCFLWDPIAFVFLFFGDPLLFPTWGRIHWCVHLRIHLRVMNDER